MTTDVSPRAWIALLHAEVAWLMREAGIDALLIKGLSTSAWLSPGPAAAGRTSVDVDVLVSPAAASAARRTLEDRGFRYTYEGMRPGEPAPHSLVFARADPQLGGHEVDLHVTLPSAHGDPAAAWGLLWARRVAAEVAGVPVWFPDLATRAILVADQAARDGADTPKANVDLRRALDLLSDAEWTDVAALARQVGMAESVRAGLETTPEGAVVAVRILPDVVVSPTWRLRAAGAPRSSVRLVELGRLPWRRRPAEVARLALPSPAMMRLRDPDLATRGRLGLGRAYLRRLGQGLRTLPAAVSAARRAR